MLHDTDGELLARGSLARDAGRAAVCHAPCAGRRSSILAHTATALGVRTPTGGWRAAADHLRNRLQECPTRPGLASQLAVPRVGYPITLLPRSRAAAHLSAGSPGTATVPAGLTGSRVAQCHTHGQVQLVAARGHANRTSQMPPFAFTSETRHLRPRRAWLPKAVRPSWRPRPRLHAHAVAVAHVNATCGRRQTAVASTSVVYTVCHPRASRCAAGSPHHRFGHPPPTRRPHPCSRMPQACNLSGIATHRRPASPRPSCGSRKPQKAAGMLTRRRLSDSSSACGHSVRRRPFVLPPPLRRWWGMLSVAVQQAVGGKTLGVPWLGFEPVLGHVLALAGHVGHSRFPLR